MKQTLNGLRILNTRPKNQAQQLSKDINDADGIAISCPTIEIKATQDAWINLLPSLNNVQLAIFVSANAVHCCFKQLKLHNIPWSENIKIIAIGKGSENALGEYNISVTATPEISDSEHLIRLPALQEIENKTILLFKGEGGRQLIEKYLLQKKAEVISLEVYQRALPSICHQFINSLWRDDLVDIILLTSEQSICNLFKIFNKEAHYWLRAKPCIVISERLAKSAALFGMKKIIISRPDGMMNTLFDYYQGLVHGQ